MIRWAFLLYTAILLHACTLTGPAGLFGKKSPHEEYEQHLTNAGLQSSALGKTWFKQAELSLSNPLNIQIPYKETGFFAAERPRATALRFEAKQGQRIAIALTKKPSKDFTIYIDLWELKNNWNKKLLAYADTSNNPFTYDIDDNGTYIIRLQPELLASGEYTLTIGNGPSLAFPVKNGKIGSFWGADRDNGGRKHEGIDIFAPKHTPAVAAADGVIHRVDVNKLGGKVIFMRPSQKNYSLYYAHLDEQLVTNGQNVHEGDTIGLVGNTGNAIYTASHLHFGIYTPGGAVDPLNFVNPVVKNPGDVTAELGSIGKSVRTIAANVPVQQGPTTTFNSATTLNKYTLVEVEAASTNWYKVILPNGITGYLNSAKVVPLTHAIKQLKLIKNQDLLDKPESTAARKTILSSGETVSILGMFNDFYFVSHNNSSGWIAIN